MEAIKQLKAKRGNLKMQLTMFSKFLEKLKVGEISNNSIINLKERLNRIQPLLNLYDEVQVELSIHLKEELEVELVEYESFQDKYFQLISESTKIINNFEKVSLENLEIRSETSSSHTSTSNSHVPRVNEGNVKLPTINLPTFSRVFTEWIYFSDSFSALIDRNLELSDCQKLFYLRSSLKGEPLNMISSLETTDSNYKIALDTLKRRYDNKRRIVNNHLHNLISVPDISKETNLKLRHFLDKVRNQLQCLKSLDQPVDEWDTLLLSILVHKLDPKIIRDWEAHINSSFENDELPAFSEFMDFLEKRLGMLEAIESRNAGSHVSNKSNVKTCAAVTATCPCCSGDHFLQRCQYFLKLDPTRRLNKAKQLKLCINCLHKGHFVNKCQSSNCKTCNMRHHSLLHGYSDSKENFSQQETSQVSKENVSQQGASQGTTSTSCSSSFCSNHILLSTAQIKLSNVKGQILPARALLDSASQSNFISKKACEALNLILKPIEMSVTGINAISSEIQFQTKVTVLSNCKNFKATIECLVLPTLTSDLPNLKVDLKDFKIPLDVKLADPTFNQGGSIDLLIGSNLFWDILCSSQFKTEVGATLHKTKLGWVIAGKINIPRINNIACLSLNSLHSDLRNFWKVDEFVTKQPLLTPEEERCENIFKSTTQRAEDGKFIVRMPFKLDVNELGNSLENAKSRFLSLERKFAKNQEFKNFYVNCINDYKNQGHLTETNNTESPNFYLPHHVVAKESSETTKYRVVFDGSSKPGDGLSINDIQHTGPTIQEDLFSILTRFRMHQYVFTADIRQMYRQVWMHPDDRRFQTILWRETPDEPIKHFNLNTVTFGMTSAPFLAIRCLMELASLNEDTFPLEADIIRKDFYVDDVLTGSSSVEGLKQIKSNLIEILSQAKFHLSKFKSNHSELGNIDQGIAVPFSECRALGVFWDPKSDIFYYLIDNQKQFEVITKRTILSNTAQLFDPLGMLAPIIIIPKIIIQKLWLLNVKWDEPIPLEIHDQWVDFKQNLSSIEKLKIPRYILVPNAVEIEMHGFADASERAYGACIYLKSVNLAGQVEINLLAAKSRVAPTRNLSLPRLELLAATLLAELMDKFIKILQVTIHKIFYWSDSKIVLSWLNSHPNKWVTFVANRVAAIQNLTDIQNLHHVVSKENPADIISRGCKPEQLINNDMWWKGPSFLTMDAISYPISKTIVSSDNQDLPEQKRINLRVLTTLVSDPIIQVSDFSKLTDLQRVMSWTLRFINNCRPNKFKRKTGPLDSRELYSALLALIKQSQIQAFATDYNLLLNKNPVNRKCPFLSLNPFMDEHGFIRVGGRLKNSQFSFDKRHPILLPKSHPLTKLIFINEHLKLLHEGPSFILNSLREHFWPLCGKNLAKATVRSCVKCFRYNSKPITPLMGELPAERVTPMPPFHTTGVDYAGPLSIGDRTGRGAKFSKCYIALFVCFTTKSVHLEAVTSLSTEAFVAALRRFIVRRGKPATIYSDNGTNFRGADNEIKKLYKFINDNSEKIADAISNETITWKFAPPHSPHFGGLYESGVKSVKYHLKRVLGDARLTFEDLYTVLTQIESVLNSRPLCPLSPDPNDLQALTPSHFLIGRSYTALRDPYLLDVKISRLNRYQYLQQPHQHFWQRWSKEYIHQLQQRQKWKTTSNNLTKDTLVLVKEDYLPPSKWKLGRILQTVRRYCESGKC